MGKISASGSFDSAPSSFVSRDKFVRRSAQDDGFVWELSGALTDIVGGLRGLERRQQEEDLHG